MSCACVGQWTMGSLSTLHAVLRKLVIESHLEIRMSRSKAWLTLGQCKLLLQCLEIKRSQGPSYHPSEVAGLALALDLHLVLASHVTTEAEKLLKAKVRALGEL